MKSFTNVVGAARVYIDRMSRLSGISKDDLWVTGGALARDMHGLPVTCADIDFGARVPPVEGSHLRSNKTRTTETERAWTTNEYGRRYQLLKRCIAPTPYESVSWFDLDHCRAFVSMRDAYIPTSLPEKLLVVTAYATPLDTLGRMIKWMNLGFKTHDIEDVAKLLHKWAVGGSPICKSSEAPSALLKDLTSQS